MKILLVEDNPGDSRLIQEILKEIGENFQVKVAETLNDGLKILAYEDTDLVILDLNLPDSNGLDTLAKLYNKYSHLPVVVMSSLSDESLALKAVQSGAQDYLVKGSIDAEVLRRTIYYAIERKEIEQKLKDQNNIVNAINLIFTNYLSCKTKEELAMLCLDVAEKITGSEMSFMGEIGPDSLLHDKMISSAGWNLCQMYDEEGHKRPPRSFKTKGLYGKVLRDGKAFISNKPFTHPESKGIPKGHPAINSFLGIPLVSGGKTIGIIVLANKKGGYKTKDLKTMESLSPTITEVLRYKQTEVDLLQTKNDLQLAQEVSQNGSWRLDVQKNELYWSEECYKIFGIPSDTPLDYQTFLSMVHPKDRDYVDKKWNSALKGGSYDIEHRIIVGNKIKWIREKAHLEYDKHGLKGGFGTAQDITERKKAEKVKIKLLQNRIQSRVRRKLAEELHDTVTQTLFSSSLLAESVLKSWEKDPQKALQIIKKVRDLNNAAFLEARTLLYELIPQKIAQESMIDLIKGLVDAVTLKFDIKFDLEFSGNHKLSQKVKHQVYRIVQEAINNIAKHSKANHVKIDLRLYPKKLKLIISDNGVGFDMKNKSFKKNFGLNIMNERAKVIGADLEIISSPGAGTRVTLSKN